MNTARKLEIITPEQKRPEPPQPGFAYKKKPIPHFERQLIDFAVPSAVKPRLKELKKSKRKKEKHAAKENWFGKLISFKLK